MAEEVVQMLMTKLIEQIKTKLLRKCNNNNNTLYYKYIPFERFKNV